MTDMKKTDDLVDDANQSKLESKPVHVQEIEKLSDTTVRVLCLVR